MDPWYWKTNIPTKTDEDGGYDYHFVTPVHQRFFCNICTKVFKDPHLAVCCGQKFCNLCLQTWFKKQKNQREICPHCRTRDFQHVIEKGMKSEIESFEIKCTKHEEGCGWTGELRNLTNHFQSPQGCQYYEVECTNKCKERNGTITVMERRNLRSHLDSSCPLRRKKCRYCTHVGTAKDSPEHLKICKKYPMKCPNSCGQRGIVRSTLPDHMKECPLQVIDCEYVEVGCKAKLERQDMPEHMSSQQATHLHQMISAYQKIKTAVAIDLATLEPKTFYSSIRTQFATLPNVSDHELYFRMMDVNSYKLSNEIWYSPSFKINGDYTLCLGVMFERGKARTECSLHLCLVKGDCDSSLKWPMTSQEKIAIRLQGQENCSRSYVGGWYDSPNGFEYDDMSIHFSMSGPRLEKPKQNLSDTPKAIKTWSVHIKEKYLIKDSLLWKVCSK